MSSMDIAALLGGAGAGGPAPDMGMAGPPPGPAGPPPDAGPGNGDDILGLLRGVLDDLDAYKAQEQDEENTLLAEKATTLIQQILANEQKQGQDAMSGTMSPKMMARAYGG